MHVNTWTHVLRQRPILSGESVILSSGTRASGRCNDMTTDANTICRTVGVRVHVRVGTRGSLVHAAASMSSAACVSHTCALCLCFSHVHPPPLSLKHAPSVSFLNRRTGGNPPAKHRGAHVRGKGEGSGERRARSRERGADEVIGALGTSNEVDDERRDDGHEA